MSCLYFNVFVLHHFVFLTSQYSVWYDFLYDHSNICSHMLNKSLSTWILKTTFWPSTVFVLFAVFGLSIQWLLVGWHFENGRMVNFNSKLTILINILFYFLFHNKCFTVMSFSWKWLRPPRNPENKICDWIVGSITWEKWVPHARLDTWVMRILFQCNAWSTDMAAIVNEVSGSDTDIDRYTGHPN